jgi:hypothetical protein
MGRRTSTIDWPVGFTVEDGRTFVVEMIDDGSLRIRIDGGDDWRSMGPPQSTPSVGAVVGRALTWWYRTYGEPIMLARGRQITEGLVVAG